MSWANIIMEQRTPSVDDNDVLGFSLSAHPTWLGHFVMLKTPHPAAEVLIFGGISFYWYILVACSIFSTIGRAEPRDLKTEIK